MWGLCDVSMMSAPIVWVQNVRVTDMWGQVNIDQSTVNMAGSQTGFGLGRSGPGRAEHVARCDAATSWPWALIGLRPQRGPHRVAHGGPALIVHGPTVGRMVDQVHHLFSLARLTCTELTHGWPARGCSPVFLPWWCSYRRRAGCEPLWRCWCPIGEGKGYPRLWQL